MFVLPSIWWIIWSLSAAMKLLKLFRLPHAASWFDPKVPEPNVPEPNMPEPNKFALGASARDAQIAISE